MRYIYISMVIIMIMISTVMIYNDWIIFGSLMLLVTVSGIINLFDIISNNKEDATYSEIERIRRLKYYYDNLTEKEKEKYVNQLQKELKIKHK